MSDINYNFLFSVLSEIADMYMITDTRGKHAAPKDVKQKLRKVLEKREDELMHYFVTGDDITAPKQMLTFAADERNDKVFVIWMDSYQARLKRDEAMQFMYDKTNYGRYRRLAEIGDIPVGDDYRFMEEYDVHQEMNSQMHAVRGDHWRKIKLWRKCKAF